MSNHVYLKKNIFRLHFRDISNGISEIVYLLSIIAFIEKKQMKLFRFRHSF